MTRYDDLVEVFEDAGISSESELEDAIRSGSETYEAWGGPGPVTLGGKIAKQLRSVKLDASSPRDWGIQQYALCQEARVPPEDVKKGLFLSRRSTIFTRHGFSYHTHRDDYIGDYPIFNVETRVSYDRDFIRDLYLYRKAIARGDLRLVPAELTTSSSSFEEGHGHRSEPEETVELLQEINHLNVLKLDAQRSIVRRVLKRYAKRQQLVHLPSLRVPWIYGLDLESILRVKDDDRLSIERFQSAFHEALAEHIANYGSLNFDRISDQVQEDIIQPRLDEMERRYRRAVTLHRSLAVAGAGLAFLPLAMTIVSQEFFDTQLAQVQSLFPAAVTGAVTSFALNKVRLGDRKGELEDSRFYVLWRLLRDR